MSSSAWRILRKNKISSIPMVWRFRLRKVLCKIRSNKYQFKVWPVIEGLIVTQTPSKLGADFACACSNAFLQWNAASLLCHYSPFPDLHMGLQRSLQHIPDVIFRPRRRHLFSGKC
jgi:hypothetical protein